MSNSIQDLKILIIDDLEDNIALIEDILDDEGFTNIHSVLDAKSGIEYLKENKVDLVILDIMMPVMDGITACKYIREELCLKDVMILLATAKDDVETLRIGLEEAGANDYTRKPFVNEIELIARIKNLLKLKHQTNIVKQKEIELKKNEQVLINQSKMAAMGEMLGNIAHQWRQPLNAISLAASGMQIKKENNELKDIEFEKLTDGILKHTDFLSEVIDDFRNFYKPNKDKEYFCMQEVMKINKDILNAGFKNQEIQIIEELIDIKIYNHKNELVQVIINLLNNAKEAIINSKIEGNKFIFIKAYEVNENIIITITDNAKGVKEDIKCKIFEPYFTTKHKQQGTGLGLYMSKKIINESLGGSFFVENVSYNYNNENYTGAKFTISLPKINR
jgi:C4-dicarboxylate-specific signal transduction histidine kinase